MSNYIHHVPGRIRVRIPSIKRNEKEAQAIQEFLETIKGVSAVSVNTVTTSVTINYDAGMVNSTAILNTLKQQNYFNFEIAAQSAAMASPNTTATTGQIFGKVVFGVLVEKVIERSAMALIAAII